MVSCCFFCVGNFFWAGVSYAYSHIDRLYYLNYMFGHLRNLENSFAPASSLFAALAMGGLALTIILQRKAISNETRSVKRQSFESVFFQLINIHNANHEWIDLSGDIPVQKRVERVYQILKKSYEYWNMDKDSLDELLKNDRASRVGFRSASGDSGGIVKLKIKVPFVGLANKTVYFKNKCNTVEDVMFYQAFHDVYGEKMTRYFRHFFHMLKHIDNGYKNRVIGDEDKVHFCNIVKSTLTHKEQGLLFYNALFFAQVLNKPKYKEMLSDFSMFDDMNPKILFDEKAVGKYPSRAFGKDSPRFVKYIEEI